MKRVLVTGATGGIGLTLVPALLRGGVEVIASGRRADRGERLAHMGGEFVPADLAENSLAALVVNVDTVFHLAARASPWGKAAEFERDNVLATRRLLEAAKAAGVRRFVAASTPTIFSERRDRIGLTEDSPVAARFIGHYPRTKFMAERLVLECDSPAMRCVAIRPRAVAGPDDATLLPRLARIARSGRIPLPRGGAALVEISDVRDVARAFIAAARADLAAGCAVNVSGGAPLAFRTLVETVCRMAHLPFRTIALPEPLLVGIARASEAAARISGREPAITRQGVAATAWSQTFDLAGAKRLIGWEPRHSTDETIAFALGGDAMNHVSIRLLEAGHCAHPQAATMRGASLKPVIFPALAALIRHPSEGWILFDTGYDRRFIEATRPFPERLYRWLTPLVIPPEEEAAAQLTAAGIDPGEVRHLILSHFHADHVAGAHRFANATIHCARAGLDDLCRRGRLGALIAGTPKGLLPPDIAARGSFFEDAPRTPLAPDLLPFEDGADLLGDGSLVAVELPGHCPGHWGLVVRTEDAPEFLVADAAWSSEAIRRDVPPPRLVANLLGDASRGRETLHRLHLLRTRNPEIVLTPSHCGERAAART